MNGFRGQSETVGVVLLTAVIVVVTTVAGAFILSDFQSETEDDPLVEVESSVTTDRIELQHRGGDALDANEITVILQGDEDETFTLLGDFDLDRGDPATFAPGTTWQRDTSGLSGEIRLLVIDDDSNTLLHEATHVVAANSTDTNLLVDTVETDDPVTEGEVLPINVTVTNTGESTTSDQDLTVDVVDNGTVVETFTEQVTVADGETATKTFSYTTERGDAPELNVSATTEDDQDGDVTTAAIADSTPGGSELLGIEDGDQAVEVGDSFDQHLTYSNPATAEETVRLVVEGNATDPDSTEIDIDPGEEITPTEVGFPEQGVILDITDDSDNSRVVVEIGEP